MTAMETILVAEIIETILNAAILAGFIILVVVFL